MNPACLEALLQRFLWKQLRDLARELGLDTRGKRAQLIQRLLELHADPCCAQEVMLAAQSLDRRCRTAEVGTKRRRSGKPAGHGARCDLAYKFEAVVAPQPQPQPQQQQAAVEAGTLDLGNSRVTPDLGNSRVTPDLPSITMDAADYGSGGSFVAETPDDGEVTSRMADVTLGVTLGVPVTVTGVPVTDAVDPSPGQLVYVPAHLCPWQPSPAGVA